MTQAESVLSTPPLNTSANTPPESTGKPQDSLYLPTDISPEEVFQAIGRLRKEARDEIHRLLTFLDETENHMSIDCEPEDEGDDADDEPSLGSFDRMMDQSKGLRISCRWASPPVDAEQDDADDEPALGSLDGQHDQTVWAAGKGGDVELDPAESGIADYDGLLEQIGSPDWQGARGGMV